MRKILAIALAAGVVACALGGAAWADTDPTVHQVYAAAASGHLDQAQQMMDQVLRAHPSSAKAHYVQAELYAREGKPTLARAELGRAEQLEPGLPKEDPRSVAELKSQLGLTRPADSPMGALQESGPHFPLGTVLIVALVLGVIWMLFRRRTASAQYLPTGMPPTPPGAYGPGPAAGPLGGGLGSTVAGGLAGGLAAGAGLVAGEASVVPDGRGLSASPPRAADLPPSAP